MDADRSAPAEPAEDGGEEMQFVHPTADQADAVEVMTPRQMRRRLPLLVGRVFVLAWRVDRRATATLLACQVASGLLAALGLLATASALTEVVAAAADPARVWRAVPAVLVLAGAAGARALLTLAVQGLVQRLEPRIYQEAGLELMLAGSRTEMAVYDDPGFADRYEQAERGVEQAQVALGQAQYLVSAVAALGAAAAVVASLYPLLLVLLAAGAVPRVWAALRAERITYTSMAEMSRDRRVLYVLRWWLTGADQADQVRTDTVAPVLLEQYRRAGLRVRATTDRAVAARFRVGVAGALASGAGSAVLWAALLGLLATGRIGTAVAGTAVVALREAGLAVQSLVVQGSALMLSGHYMDDWERFVRAADEQRVDRTRGALVPGRPARIALEGVVYRYPGTERDTLRGVDFEVRAGEVVAVVGENGSGKSTLMRLLCGLNLPTGGAARWDGREIGEYDAEALWRLCGVVPQSFARWPMSARENITLGQPHPDGDAAVWRAAKASGADEVVARLRSGLDTLLAKAMWGGQPLSGGEWQRVALARALHRASGLLVLDEPTSDMDPRAEHRVFQQLREAADGAAVVLVTHNLENTRVADRIYVLADGQVVQHGSWDELSQEEGRFRELLLLRGDRPAAAGTTP
ncbi:ATP-binding cassette domain-containing protein [Kitasatospora sp. NPDC088134]|uniref:ATP-binding cassette domain-containing protein n=1 Tax=Kitasatospora sp. NPDC088134 TaxID=3364071 RepID=UPI0037F71BD7